MLKWPRRHTAEERIAARERIHARGKGRFILIHGVFSMGHLHLRSILPSVSFSIIDIWISRF